jgi:cell division protein FtsL
MMSRTIVIRRKNLGWQSKIKRKTQTKKVKRTYSAGFVSPIFVVIACMVFSGIFYMYSVNQTAVKGIEIRRIEKEISEKKKNNESLKIREAELKSLYNIEESSKQLDMVNSENVKYIEENQSVAFDSKMKK